MRARKTILFVDDEDLLLEALLRRARDAGFDVLSARNPLTALSLLERQPPDLICADVNMPTGNGLGLCEHIARDPRWQQIPLVVLTGRNDADTRQRVDRLGARYVQKGADAWSHLRPAIEQQLGMHRAAE